MNIRGESCGTVISSTHRNSKAVDSKFKEVEDIFKERATENDKKRNFHIKY